jgi:hypothetical protein
MLDRGPSPIRPPPFGGMASYQVEAMSPVADEFHPVFHAGAVAVITGAASGIGRAAAEELAKCVCDLAVQKGPKTNQCIPVDWV